MTGSRKEYEFPAHISASIVMVPSAADDAATVLKAGDKIFFSVPFERRDVAKAAGLKWDFNARKWYAETKQIADACSGAFDQRVDDPAAAERHYFQVPFLQKERAKTIGMRFDGARKLWFAESTAVALVAAGAFPKFDDLKPEDAQIRTV